MMWFEARVPNIHFKRDKKPGKRVFFVLFKTMSCDILKMRLEARISNIHFTQRSK